MWRTWKLHKAANTKSNSTPEPEAYVNGKEIEAEHSTQGSRSTAVPSTSSKAAGMKNSIKKSTIQ